MCSGSSTGKFSRIANIHSVHIFSQSPVQTEIYCCSKHCVRLHLGVVEWGGEGEGGDGGDSSRSQTCWCPWKRVHYFHKACVEFPLNVHFGYVVSILIHFWFHSFPIFLPNPSWSPMWKPSYGVFWCHKGWAYYLRITCVQNCVVFLHLYKSFYDFGKQLSGFEPCSSYDESWDSVLRSALRSIYSLRKRET